MKASIRVAWGAVVLAAIAGCSQPGGTAVATRTSDPGMGAVGAPAGDAIALPASAARHGFASLPDRGELVAYPGNVVQHDGAYTWHRTDLSEAHALNAIASGHLRVTTPSGEALDVQYDRSVEHPSGDWTWIGHIPGQEGIQTILTFGAHAAYGSIGQPDKPPLRLTVRNGASWLVETDPRGIAALDNAATRPKRPDYRIPPKPDSASTPTAGATMAQASAPAMASATASSTTTVDLVLGYTPAFANDHGGTSGAITRLNYLVDVTNAAYTNSQVAARVRLVDTVLVNYPDNTANDSTLDQLTGYDSSNNTQVQPNAAFDALRSAREQYGADLVSLVRSFRDPENAGCGVGWLIGGGQTGISTSDSYYGYSVVSDGTDTDTSGKSYFCLDETLAHELGHNMGANHDVDTAKGTDGTLNASDYGAYSYSFGYKNNTYGFYTVMAYGDSGQHIYRIFSDPRSTFCGGQPCGTSQADNARTLAQSIPIVAGFRATVVADAPSRVLLKQVDTDGNGRSDLLLRSHSLGRVVTWFMSGTTRTAASSITLGGSYTLVGTGDFNGDHRTDLLWTSPARDLLISMSSGTSYSTTTTPYTYTSGTQVIGAADVNGNGTADILLRNAAAGRVYVWFMSGTTRVATSSNVVAASYDFVGSGDLNHDGRQDLVWTSANRDVLVSTSTGINFTSGLIGLNYSSSYDLAGLTDVNGDGSADLLLRSQSLGKLVTWFMNGNTRVAASSATVGGAYRLVGKGDFNGDHWGDLVWVDGTGKILMTLSTGSNFTNNPLSYVYSTDYLMMDAG